MFSIVHVLLPFTDAVPAEAIRASLALFERGGRGDVPDEWLAFHDETEHVAALHECGFVFTHEPGQGLRIQGGDAHYLDSAAVIARMEAHAVTRWTVRFADIEPDLPAFAEHFVRGLERHPITGGFGRWLNPLGRWDWWDLGGRFDGRILGDRRKPGRSASVVSSGSDRGRTLLDNIGEALGSDQLPDRVVEADNNVEMVSRLLEDARAGRDHAFPGAILLPPGAVENVGRWLRSWPDIGPAATVSWLGQPTSAEWKSVVIAAYERFPDHWAAGVAFHL